MLEIPSLKGQINFNAQHSPMGAFMSFTCGHFGSGGGIGVEVGRPAKQNLIVGVKRGERRAKGPVRCLPFATGDAGGGAASYDAERAAAAAAGSPTIATYPENQIRRHYGWATDYWTTPEFTFSLYTPFDLLPEPPADREAFRAALLPAVIATLRIDNREGTMTRTGVFALDFPDPGTRLLAVDGEKIATGPRRGFAWRRQMGALGMLEEGGDGLHAFQRWSVPDGLADVNPIHALGSCGGLAFEVPAGQVRTLVIAIGVYLDSIVTTGLEGKYYYTRFYSGLEDVLGAALDRSRELREKSAALDEKLLLSGLTADQQFLIAHGTRSYYGSTQLLDVGGEPFWVVNEGEYCMMNTLDLSVDHAFWELDHNPWVVKNLLDNFVRHYSYSDGIKRPDGSIGIGGISFCHDMGANNNFSSRGHSSYELPNLSGCFSYMTQEQLCNWVLLAGCYVAKTGDMGWAKDNEHVLRACLESLNARRGPEVGDWMRFDAARCGSGSEITTYDSLDESLGQARNNLYIAVKRWAAYAGLRMMDIAAGLGGFIAHQAAAEMEAFPARLAKMAQRDDVIPAVFEPGNPGYRSRILAACEALVYPWYWSTCGKSFDGGVEQTRLLVDILRKHTAALLNDTDRQNFFDDGGIKLSSTSNNSWMSKIAILQHVCRHVLGLNGFADADAAHVRWQTEGSSYWACSDQIISGQAKASRYYPRIITTALWLSPKPEEGITPVNVRVAGEKV